MTPSKSKLPSLSVVLPAFNEASNLDAVFRDALRFLNECVSDFEIIVVNDGSTDRTQQIVEKWAAFEPRIRLIQTYQNLGYGSAVTLGLSAAKKQYVLLTDCDRQFSLAALSGAAPLVSDNVIVAGYRWRRADTPWRRLLGWLYGFFIAKCIFNLQIRDVNCAFKIIPKELLSKIVLSSHGALISVELLVRARNSGFNIVQFPVSHFRRVSGISTGGNLHVAFRAIKEALTLRRQQIRLTAP